MTREINPMNAVAFAFLVARIRSRAFWILLGWTFVWMVLGFALQLRIMPVPTMDGSGMPADMSGYMLQQLLALGVSAVVWILPFVAWMRLLTLGQDGGPVPLRFGASELWGLICPKTEVFQLFHTFRPLVRPMEGGGHLDHTNFSRRIHPRHPEFLPLSWMSKS